MPLTDTEDLFTVSAHLYTTKLHEQESDFSATAKGGLEEMIQTARTILTIARDVYGAGRLTPAAYATALRALVDLFGQLDTYAKQWERRRAEHIAHSCHLYIWQLEAEKELKRVLPHLPPADRMTFEITEEEGEQLEKLLSAPPDSVGKLNFETKRVPEFDPSRLKKK